MDESTKPEICKHDTAVEGNGQVPPGQTEDEDGTIVNPGGNVAPGLNRDEHIDKLDNPNKPDKPENPGTEDKDETKALQSFVNEATKRLVESLNRKGDTSDLHLSISD